MNLAEDINFDIFVNSKEDLSGADVKAICTEAGLLALRYFFKIHLLRLCLITPHYNKNLI
jgi:ATP-dependent 26S proteasome regulatory subunit